MKVLKSYAHLCVSLPVFVGCTGETAGDDTATARLAVSAQTSQPSSAPQAAGITTTANQGEGMVATQNTSNNLAAWQTLHGAQTAAAMPPPAITLKLNDNLSAFARILLPALARTRGLNGMALPSLPLLSDTTRADMGILGDIFFSCHDEDTPIVLELRDLYLDMGVDQDSFTVNIGGTSTIGSAISFDADLPDLSLTGRLYLDWPAKKGGLLCHDFHVEIPFSVDGASLASSASFSVQNDNLNLDSVWLSKLSISNISFDSGLLTSLGDIGLAVTDTIVAAFQDLQDGLHQVDLQPERGICNTAGTTADLEACVASVVSGHVAETLLDRDGKFYDVIQDVLRSALPTATSLNVGSYTASVAPEIVSYTESNSKDNVKLQLTLLPSSSAPTAACAASVTPAPPHGTAGSFDALKDVDMVIPFDNIEAVLYEFTRQGLFCIPPSSIGIATASIDPSGPVTLSNRGTLTLGSAETSTNLNQTANGTGSSSGGSTRARTAAPAGGNTSNTVSTGVSAGTTEMQVPDLYTTHPLRLNITGGLVSGAVTLTAELGWALVFTCNNQVALELISAKRVAISGSVSLGRLGSVSADDPQVRAQIDALLAALPRTIPQLPLGPSMLALPAGVYLELKEIATSEREIAFGLKLKDQRPQACVSPSSGTVGSQGNDVDNGPDLGSLDIPREPGKAPGAEPGTLGGASTDAASTIGSNPSAGSRP